MLEGLTVTIDIQEIMGSGGDVRTEIINQTGRHIAKSVRDELREDIRDRIEKQIRKAVDSLVNDELLRIMRGGIRLTNHFGEPKGPCKTFRDLMIEKVKETVESRVDTHGRKSTGYGSERNKTFLQYHAEETYKQYIKDGFDDEMAKAKQSLREMLNGKIDVVLRRAVCEVLNLPKDIAEANGKHANIKGVIDVQP